MNQTTFVFHHTLNGQIMLPTSNPPICHLRHLMDKQQIYSLAHLLSDSDSANEGVITSCFSNNIKVLRVQQGVVNLSIHTCVCISCSHCKSYNHVRTFPLMVCISCSHCKSYNHVRTFPLMKAVDKLKLLTGGALSKKSNLA